QIECLLAATGPIPGGESVAHGGEHVVVVAERAPEHEGLGIFDGLANGFATRHFANPRTPRTIKAEHQIAGEEGAVRAAQVEEHTVVAGDGNNLERGHDRRALAHFWFWRTHAQLAPLNGFGSHRGWPRVGRPDPARLRAMAGRGPPLARARAEG